MPDVIRRMASGLYSSFMMAEARGRRPVCVTWNGWGNVSRDIPRGMVGGKILKRTELEVLLCRSMSPCRNDLDRIQVANLVPVHGS